jgi:hypothetical protein
MAWLPEAFSEAGIPGLAVDVPRRRRSSGGISSDW